MQGMMNVNFHGAVNVGGTFTLANFDPTVVGEIHPDAPPPAPPKVVHLHPMMKPAGPPPAKGKAKFGKAKFGKFGKANVGKLAGPPPMAANPAKNPAGPPPAHVPAPAAKVGDGPVLPLVGAPCIAKIAPPPLAPVIDVDRLATSWASLRNEAYARLSDALRSERNRMRSRSPPRSPPPSSDSEECARMATGLPPGSSQDHVVEGGGGGQVDDGLFLPTSPFSDYEEDGGQVDADASLDAALMMIGKHAPPLPMLMDRAPARDFEDL